jgi:hypothetical protein
VENNKKIDAQMSNFEQTAERRADNFLADVGGIHTMPEQSASGDAIACKPLAAASA